MLRFQVIWNLRHIRIVNHLNHQDESFLSQLQIKHITTFLTHVFSSRVLTLCIRSCDDTVNFHLRVLSTPVPTHTNLQGIPSSSASNDVLGDSPSNILANLFKYTPSSPPTAGSNIPGHRAAKSTVIYSTCPPSRERPPAQLLLFSARAFVRIRRIDFFCLVGSVNAEEEGDDLFPGIGLGFAKLLLFGEFCGT